MSRDGDDEGNGKSGKYKILVTPVGGVPTVSIPQEVPVKLRTEDTAKTKRDTPAAKRHPAPPWLKVTLAVLGVASTGSTAGIVLRVGSLSATVKDEDAELDRQRSDIEELRAAVTSIQTSVASLQTTVTDFKSSAAASVESIQASVTDIQGAILRLGTEMRPR